MDRTEDDSLYVLEVRTHVFIDENISAGMDGVGVTRDRSVQQRIIGLNERIEAVG